VVKRLAFHCLTLAGILLVCLGHLIWNGARAAKTIATNLAVPEFSGPYRDVDLWHPTASPGHVFDLTFTSSREGRTPVPPGARLEVQIASGGKTRLLVVRGGHPNTSVGFTDLLLGRERLQVVADRGWVDLGPLSPTGEKTEVQVFGLLPGSFGFAEPYYPKSDEFTGFRLRRPDSPLARPSRGIIRYRFLVGDPAAPAETLARAFFFVSSSRVLQVAGTAALFLIFMGWHWLGEKRFGRAVACLVPGLTLLHACALPPFQGEDGPAHAGTVEMLIWQPANANLAWGYPESFAAVGRVLDYPRWAGNSSAPVPLAGPEARRSLASALDSTMADKARRSVPPTESFFPISPKSRAPLYYHALATAAPLARLLSVLDRTEAYVVLSAWLSLLFFLAGLAILRRNRLSPEVSLVYGLVALVPFMVAIVASCSNYSLAIGIGSLLAACTLALVLSNRPRPRAEAGVVLVAAAWLGVGVWDDFIFVAAPATVVLLVAGLLALTRRAEPRFHRLGIALSAAAGGAVAIGLGWALASGALRRLFIAFAARSPREFSSPGDPTAMLVAAVAAVPFVAALLMALSSISSQDRTEATKRRWAAARTAAAGLIVVGMFLATAYTAVPFEYLRLDFADEVAAHWNSFWSNNLSWDQDTLFWKMYWGVFGSGDTWYPAAVYALARWACVAFFVALPVLSARFTAKRPTASPLLLVLSGYALAACVVTNSLRYLGPTNPWGRFILPLVPLAALPVLARVTDQGRERALAIALRAFVVLHLWTALTLLPTRYCVGL
jgi:hypothetical protein